MTKIPHKRGNTFCAILRLHWIIYIVVAISFAQEEGKKRLFYDEIWRPITENEFTEKQNVQFNLPVHIANDTAIIKRLIPRETYGYMKRKTRLDLINMLTTISGRKIDEWNTVVVNFHFKEANAIHHYTSQKHFIKKMQRTFSVEQFFITEQDYSYKKDKVAIYEDRFDGVRRLLFDDYFEGDNYAIIKPNGQYYRYYGEYDISKVFGQVKADWRIDFNEYRKSIANQRDSIPVKIIGLNSEANHQSSKPGLPTGGAETQIRFIYTKDLVMINKNFKSRYPNLVTYYYHNDAEDFNEVRGDFFNIKVPNYKTLNMDCSFWARWGRYRNILQVKVTLPGDSNAKLNPSGIKVSSRIHGELLPAKEKSFPATGKYGALIFQKEIILSKPREILEKIKNDIVTLYIDGVKYEFIAPEFD